uniref:Uncharacterized protein n=1 Tax=Clavibacter phage CN77 TaxID=686440 RepID=D0VPQ1_9VIRU|nr:hypothetical protein CN77-05 [Clavibacter phage CN77]
MDGPQRLVHPPRGVRVGVDVRNVVLVQAAQVRQAHDRPALRGTRTAEPEGAERVGLDEVLKAAVVVALDPHLLGVATDGLVDLRSEQAHAVNSRLGGLRERSLLSPPALAREVTDVTEHDELFRRLCRDDLERHVHGSLVVELLAAPVLEDAVPDLGVRDANGRLPCRRTRRPGERLDLNGRGRLDHRPQRVLVLELALVVDALGLELVLVVLVVELAPVVLLERLHDAVLGRVPAVHGEDGVAGQAGAGDDLTGALVPGPGLCHALFEDLRNRDRVLQVAADRVPTEPRLGLDVRSRAGHVDDRAVLCLPLAD